MMDRNKSVMRDPRFSFVLIHSFVLDCVRNLNVFSSRNVEFGQVAEVMVNAAELF